MSWASVINETWLNFTLTWECLMCCCWAVLPLCNAIAFIIFPCSSCNCADVGIAEGKTSISRVLKDSHVEILFPFHFLVRNSFSFWLIIITRESTANTNCISQIPHTRSDHIACACAIIEIEIYAFPRTFILTLGDAKIISRKWRNVNIFFVFNYKLLSASSFFHFFAGLHFITY